MHHYPTIEADGDTGLVRSIADSAAQSRGVHGALIALLLIQAIALLEFVRIGRADWRNRSGLPLWLVALLTMIGAALISGFVSPAVAEGMLRRRTDAATRGADLLRQALHTNQALAKCAVFAAATAIAL